MDKIRVTRRLCLVSGGFVLGFIVALLTSTDWSPNRISEGVGWEISGVDTTGSGLSLAHYENGRLRMRSTASIFNSDTWGCTWLTGGIEVETVQVGRRWTLTSLSALISSDTGRDDDVAAAFGGDVTIDSVEGHRAVADGAVVLGQTMELRGNPARLLMSRGDEFFAPRFVMSQGDEGALISGDQDVSLRFVDDHVFGQQAAEGWIAADRFVANETATHFEGNVRAWSGGDLMVSHVLEIAGERVIAEGAVRLSLRDEIVAQIVAQRMEKSDDHVTFTGDVVFESEDTTAECEILVISMDGTGKASGYRCSGGALVVSPSRGLDRLEADVAAFSGGTLEAWGSPATVESSREGLRTLSAPYIVYDTVTGAGRAGEVP